MAIEPIPWTILANPKTIEKIHLLLTIVIRAVPKHALNCNTHAITIIFLLPILIISPPTKGAAITCAIGNKARKRPTNSCPTPFF